MTRQMRVLHLIDDTTPGGVTRVIDHLTRAPELSPLARQMVRVVPRGGALPACDTADVVISHLTISWRSLPRLIAFRARHARMPILHVEHSYTEAFTARNVPAKGRFFTLLRTAYALFDRVIAVSAAQGGWLEGRGLVRSGSLLVIPSAVDLAAFRALPAPARPARVIGAIGRLHRQKGLEVLISAFRMLPRPDLELRLYGTGPEEAALKALAAGDSRITFCGHAQDPVAALAGIDMVAMPSRWEAFGLSALEARAAGRVVVHADLDGLPESGRGGVPVRGHAPEAWAVALREGLARSCLPVPAFGTPPEARALALWADLLTGFAPKPRAAAEALSPVEI